MSAIHWLNPLSGNFTHAADWSGGKVPGASDDAILDAVGSSFTVTSASSQTVNSLRLAANATLSITGGTFDALAGTGAGANAGVILVGANDTLSLGGVVTNSGAITLNSPQATNNYAQLTLAAGVTLTGGGVINDAGQINAGAAGATITNLNNTILADVETSYGIDSLFADSPAGTVFVNGKNGVVDSQSLLFVGGQQGLSIVNHGMIESSGYMDFTDTSVSGAGQLAVSDFGEMQFSGPGVVSGQSLSVGAQASLFLAGGGVDYTGVFDNAGTTRLYTTGSTPALFLTGVTTLSGGGTVIFMPESQAVAIGGKAGKDTLINVDNTLSGGGDLGNGQIGIVNEAAGVITGLQTIDSGSQTITNQGLIMANGYGAPTIIGSIVNTGTIECIFGTLTIEDAVSNNGLLSVGAVGRRGYTTLTLYGQVSGTGSTVIGNGGTLNADGLFSEYHNHAFEQSVTFTGAGFLHLAASREYAGAISGFSSAGMTSLDLGDIGFVSSSQATFSGTASGGVLTVADGKHAARITLNGDYLSSTFVTVNDGHGGVIVVALPAPGGAPPHAFVAAMAGLGGPAASAVRLSDAWRTSEPTLSGPRQAIA